MEIRAGQSATSSWENAGVSAFVVGWGRRVAGSGSVPMTFTPDGAWVLYHDQDPDGNDALYRVSISGGAAQRIGGYPTNSVLSDLAGWRKPPAVDDQGRKLTETWILENFISQASFASQPVCEQFKSPFSNLVKNRPWDAAQCGPARFLLPCLQQTFSGTSMSGGHLRIDYFHSTSLRKKRWFGCGRAEVAEPLKPVFTAAGAGVVYIQSTVNFPSRTPHDRSGVLRANQSQTV